MVSISTENSQQDQKTPSEFIDAVQGRFGSICFDLAAHAGNKQHHRYFAPTHFTSTLYSPSPDVRPKVDGLPIGILDFKRFDKKRDRAVWTFQYQNHDCEAAGFDSFTYNWHQIAGTQGRLLWLNCEWGDIQPWVDKCVLEAQRGAYIALLTHHSVADWYMDCLEHGDVYELKGRLSFDGKAPFPKDCMLTIFRPDAIGRSLNIWDWREDKILASYSKS